MAATILPLVSGAAPHFFFLTLDPETEYLPSTYLTALRLRKHAMTDLLRLRTKTMEHLQEKDYAEEDVRLQRLLTFWSSLEYMGMFSPIS